MLHQNDSEPMVPAFLVIPRMIPSRLADALFSMFAATVLPLPPVSCSPGMSDPETPVLEATVPEPPLGKKQETGEMATAGQLKFIRGVAKKQGIAEEDIARQHGVSRLDLLSKRQASKWLEEH